MKCAKRRDFTEVRTTRLSFKASRRLVATLRERVRVRRLTASAATTTLSSEIVELLERALVHEFQRDADLKLGK